MLRAQPGRFCFQGVSGLEFRFVALLQRVRVWGFGFGIFFCSKGFGLGVLQIASSFLVRVVLISVSVFAVWFDVQLLRCCLRGGGLGYLLTKAFGQVYDMGVSEKRGP